MRIGVLGPLEVVSDGRAVDVGGFRLRALLIRLALDAGSVVTSRALAGALWPEEIPDHPGPALHSLVSRLRRVLPGRGLLRSEPAGYLLDVPREDVDVARFERLASDGQRALRAGRPAAALPSLDGALDLWRGEPLADVAVLPFAASAAVRLEELRLGAAEDRIEAGLATGRQAPGAVAELERLVAAHPLRERLRELLMRTLAAHGRQAEALAAFEAYRRLLDAELGTGPGPELRELHVKLLRGDHAGGGGARGNVRAALTGLLGRDGELRLVAERLATGRLVTLVGPGGVGKTRLAAAAAAATPGEVWWAELGAVTDPADVPPAVTRAMGLRSRADATEQLAESFAGTDSLLVLDNCEHVAGAAAALAGELLGRCPGLRVLATSREPLRITGEALCPVPPLAPDEAVRLFTARALAVRPDFAPTARAGEICARLDGLPLAIELAAARLRTMSPDRLADRLDDRFRLLTGGSRTALPRHRTLLGVVEWSWELLDSTGRQAAELAAVFPAAFTAEAAAEVGVGEDALHALVDKSLLQFDGDRYRMLETVREYGLSRLAGTGRLRAARAAHAACYLALAERAAPRLRGSGQLGPLALLAAERDHLLAALRTACEDGDADTAVRLGAALAMFWTVRGEHAEATGRLRAALRVPGRPAPGPRRTAVAAYLLNALLSGALTDATQTLAYTTKALTGTTKAQAGGAAEVVSSASGADVVDELGDVERALGAFAEALVALAGGATADGLAALEPHLGAADPWVRGMVWLARAFLHGTGDGMEAGRADLVAAAEAFRTAGERWGLALTLMSLASVEIAADAYDPAVAALAEAERLAAGLGTHDELGVWVAMVSIHAGRTEEARTRLRELAGDGAGARGSRRQVAAARVALADLARCEGDLGEAARQLRLAGDEGDASYRALYAAGAGHLAVAAGELGTAARRLREALTLAAGMPDPPMAAQVGVGLADLLLRRGEPARAAEILGAATALRGGPDERHPDVARLTRALDGSPAHRAAYERGRALDRAAALAALQQV